MFALMVVQMQATTLTVCFFFSWVEDVQVEASDCNEAFIAWPALVVSAYYPDKQLNTVQVRHPSAVCATTHCILKGQQMPAGVCSFSDISSTILMYGCRSAST